jgi:hypothetical protein
MTYPSPSGHIAGPHSSRGDFIDELNDAIRQNPVPAVLIGAGLLWMFMGGARNTVLGGASWSLFSGIAQGAQHTGAAAYRGAREVGGGCRRHCRNCWRGWFAGRRRHAQCSWCIGWCSERNHVTGDSDCKGCL